MGKEDINAATSSGRTCCDCGEWKSKENYWVYKPTGNLEELTR